MAYVRSERRNRPCRTLKRCGKYSDDWSTG